MHIIVGLPCQVPNGAAGQYLLGLIYRLHVYVLGLYFCLMICLFSLNICSYFSVLGLGTLTEGKVPSNTLSKLCL